MFTICENVAQLRPADGKENDNLKKTCNSNQTVPPLCWLYFLKIYTCPFCFRIVDLSVNNMKHTSLQSLTAGNREPYLKQCHVGHHIGQGPVYVQTLEDDVN